MYMHILTQHKVNLSYYKAYPAFVDPQCKYLSLPSCCRLERGPTNLLSTVNLRVG